MRLEDNYRICTIPANCKLPTLPHLEAAVHDDVPCLVQLQLLTCTHASLRYTYSRLPWEPYLQASIHDAACYKDMVKVPLLWRQNI
jgi:hypothetical protein